MSPDEIVAYEQRYRTYYGAAYRWDLWGAGSWLGGGCSDDGFIDFRSCLISLGRDSFFRVLNDPDTLAELVDRPDMPYMQYEGFQYVAAEVYEELTGEDAMPESPSGWTHPREPAGEPFDFDDETVMAQRFPKLVARFPDMGD